MSKLTKKILAVGFFVSALSVQALADVNGYQITPETQDIINQAISEFPDEVKYIQGIAELYQKVSDLSEAEYNSLVQDATQNFVEFKEEQISHLINTQGIDDIIRDQFDRELHTNAIQNMTDAVLALQLMGLSHTAEALGYSREFNYDLVGTNYEKDPLVYDNDDWARSLFWDSDLNIICFQKFEELYYLEGKTTGSFSGSYEYTIPDNVLTADRSLTDMAMQLHNVKYNVAYAPRSNDLADGFYIHLYISDRYDFRDDNELDKSYSQYIVQLANNNCSEYQKRGYLHPFDIHIIYDF